MLLLRNTNKQIGDWLYCDDFNEIPEDVLRFGLVNIRVQMDVRGTPKDGCFICFPTEEDQNILSSWKKEKRGSPDLEMEKIKHNVSSKPNTDESFSFSTSRDILGFVTSGGHVYSQGNGAAMATCSFFGLYLLRRFYDSW